MGPPLYADLDKKCKDIFTKGYNFNLIKLDCKTKANNELELSAGGSHTTDSNRNSGNLEAKYKVEEHGLTLTERVNSDNQLYTEVAFQKDSVFPGGKVSVDTTFVPTTGEKSGRVKIEYKNDMFAGNVITDLYSFGPLITASGVVGQSGWYAGGGLTFDPSSSHLTKNSVGIGYDAGDTIVIGTLSDAVEYGGAIYQRVNDQLETGIQLGWNTGTDANPGKVGLGAKYLANSDITVGVKLDNLSQLGLSYQHKLQQGVTATVSALIEGKHISEGGHKIGLALEVEV